MDLKQIKAQYTIRNSCRLCGNNTLKDILRFPDIPIADSLLTDEQIDKPEILIPLTFVVCTTCSHAQIKEDALPEVLFNKDYPYYTGVSAALTRHFVSSAQDLIDKYKLNTSKRILEIASNDGTMLNIFYQAGCITIGVDPATGPCKVASSKGLNVLNTFFDSKIAKQISRDFGKADLILGNNVLAHVPEPNDLVAGISELLAKDGHVVIEVPHLLTLLSHVEFDTIFHQHYSYFSIHTVESLFARHGIFLNDVEQIPIHGGSIRVFLSWNEGKSDRLIALKKEEEAAGLLGSDVYDDFAERVHRITSDLKRLLEELKKTGQSVVGYGAAGKANTLINVSDIGTEDLKYIADLSPYKQGKYFTGAHIPIVEPSRILEELPDYVLILAWNFKEEIMQQLSAYHDKGGKFIIPIPEVKVVG
jgi:SAM-dependent methyltransferase